MIDMICDGNSLFARSWFAALKDAPDPVLTLRYALNTVLLLLNPDTNRIGYNFDRTLFCWDGAHNPDKGRADKPPEYHEAKTVFKEVLTEMLHTAHAEHPKFEGDDLVATAVYNSKSDRIYVVSGDKDLLQLKTKTVLYYCLNAKAVLSDAYITSKWHIKRPSHVSIALAIIGDPVDNIPGIRGWGPKKVQKLFEDITPDMNFAEVVQAIDEKIPDDKKQEFYSSLERTLLSDSVPGVPEPQPLVFAPPEDIDTLDIPFLGAVYRQVYRVYNVEPF